MADRDDRFRGGTWKPKYPEFAAEREGPLADEPDDSGAEPWTEAPEDSHLARFRYWDARKYRHLRTLLGGVSQLNVVFKATNTKPETSYTYEFRDAAEGERVFALMREAESPGEIVHAELIRKGVPYTRDS